MANKKSLAYRMGEAIADAMAGKKSRVLGAGQAKKAGEKLEERKKKMKSQLDRVMKQMQ